MAEAQPKVPQKLEKKEGTEKASSKLDSPETQAALTKKAGNKIIEDNLASLPNTREDWEGKPEETEKTNTSKDNQETLTPEGLETRDNW